LWPRNKSTSIEESAKDVLAGDAMGTDRGVSRRQILRVSAVVASSAAAVAVVSAAGDVAAADPGRAPDTGKRAELGRVANADTALLRVEAPDQANNSRVRSPQLVPFVGFPDHVVPRVGDLVTVTDDWPGVALAAVPVCHWVTGVPKAQPGGTFTIGGTAVEASPLLQDVGAKRVTVCVLDTELSTAQVLATRAA
jgi:hypothetical protein